MSNTISCLQCNLTFSHKGNLRRHKKRVHSQEDTDIACNQVCGVCKEKCRTILDLDKHIHKEHPDIKLQFHEKVFYCQSDFDRWKAEIERQTISSFTLHNTKKNEDLTILQYRCHRTGRPVLKSASERKRRTKISGSIKTGITCPSRMKVTKQVVNEATQISVEYQSTHLGHKFEVNKLPFKIGKNVEYLGQECKKRRNYDLTLLVGDKKLQAHRDSLRARSRVFESMLSHKMIEKNSNFIVIPDCDPQSMELLLSYVHCGKVQKLDQSNMLGLYYIADKYEMGDLKEECRNFIEKSLLPTNICEIIQLALIHCDSGLSEKATEYFTDNALNILRTVEWQLFMKDNSQVANELLIKAFQKKGRKEITINIKILK